MFSALTQRGSVEANPSQDEWLVRYEFSALTQRGSVEATAAWRFSVGRWSSPRSRSAAPLKHRLWLANVAFADVLRAHAARLR